MDNILKSWMLENGYTNKTLADKMNFSYEYIYKMSTGKADVTDAFKWRFAEVFGFEQAINMFGSETESI